MALGNIDLYKSSFLVLTDVHADPRSLRAVLKAAWDPAWFRYRCFLGDAIGYGDDPAGALNILKDFDVCIKGNHEMLALGQVSASWYSENARETILDHTRKLSVAHRNLISKFVDNLASGKVILFHGVPDSPLDYIFNDVDARVVFEQYPQYDLFIGGHLHIPRMAIYHKETHEIDFAEISLPYCRFDLDFREHQYLITCPSTTPGRFGAALPGCCRVIHKSEDEKELEFIFVRQELG